MSTCASIHDWTSSLRQRRNFPTRKHVGPVPAATWRSNQLLDTPRRRITSSVRSNGSMRFFGDARPFLCLIVPECVRKCTYAQKISFSMRVPSWLRQMQSCRKFTK